MGDSKYGSAPLDELSPPQPDSTRPAYLAWKKAKVRAAIKVADENPNDVATHEEMRKKFGLDY